MSHYNFTDAEYSFISQFLNECFQIICWKEYGPTAWCTMFDTTIAGDLSMNPPIIIKMKVVERKIVRTMIKSGLLIPEIENDKEYKVQYALGCTPGRIYYMPKEIREDIKKLYDKELYA